MCRVVLACVSLNKSMFGSFLPLLVDLNICKMISHVFLTCTNDSGSKSKSKVLPGWLPDRNLNFDFRFWIISAFDFDFNACRMISHMFCTCTDGSGSKQAGGLQARGLGGGQDVHTYIHARKFFNLWRPVATESWPSPGPPSHLRNTPI